MSLDLATIGCGKLSCGLRLRLFLLTTACALTAGILPASASAGPLDCSGATVYTVQRGSTSSSASDAAVFALASNTVGGSAVTATPLTSIPGGGAANALGATKDGTGLYAVDQFGTAGSTTVFAYSAAAGTWSSYTGTAGQANGFVAGAVDPANGIYYYVNYTTGTTTKPGVATVYGFDTNRNTAIPGVIATFDLPDGAGAAPQNGDIAFDGLGDMYVLASDGATLGVGVIKGPIPTSGSATGASLAVRTLSSTPKSSTYNGIAFDNNGSLYLQSRDSSGTAYITALDADNGSVISGPSPIGANAQAHADVDLAACSLPPTLTAQASVAARVNPSDQFTLAITGGTVTGGNTATTSGSSTGVQPQTAGPIVGRPGTTYTVSETAASGSLSDYDTTYSCVDPARGNVPVTSGTGTSYQLPFPAPQTGQTGPNVACTFSNTPRQADLRIVQTPSSQTVAPGGQVTYTLVVQNQGPDSATQVQVSDALPSGLSVVSVRPAQGSCTTTGTVSCSLGTIANGGSVQVLVTADVSRSATGSLTNTATTNAHEADPNSSDNTSSSTIEVVSAPVPAAQADANPSSNAPSSTIQGVAAPSQTVDVQVVNRVDRAVTRFGDVLTYTLTVSNNGPGSAPDVLVSDTSLLGLRVLSTRASQGSCTSSVPLRCRLGFLASGKKVTIVIRAVPSQPGHELNTASAAVACDSSGGCPRDTNAANNLSSVGTIVRSHLILAETTDRAVVKGGGHVTFHLNVGNPTAATLRHVRLCEQLPLGLVYVGSRPRAQLSNGRVCWNLANVRAHGLKAVSLTARALRGASGVLVSRAVVSADGVSPAQADRRVRVIAARAPRATAVTG